MFNISELKYKFNWGHDEPESLYNIALEYILKNVNPVLAINDENGSFKLRDDILLPFPISTSIMEQIMNFYHPLEKEILQLFTKTKQFPIQRLNFTNKKDISEKLFIQLISNNNISRITYPSTKIELSTVLDTPKYCNDLIYLSFPHETLISSELNSFDKNLFSESLKSLQHLILNKYMAININFSKLTNLLYIDLTNCVIQHYQLNELHLLSKLKYLSLHNVPLEDLKESLGSISKINSLIALDIGQSSDDVLIKSYQGDIDSIMENLVSSLPKLQYLELTGTNLAGKVENQSHFYQSHKFEKTNSIKWLDGHAPLIYLGLLNCHDNPSSKENIPAENVSGDSNIDQVLVSVEYYINRPHILVDALNSLFEFVKFHNTLNINHQRKSLEVIMNAMNANRNNRNIQISGSASLFYIVNWDLKDKFTSKIKKSLTKLLIDSMNIHIEDITMLRNCCLTFCHFKLPQDVMSCYSELTVLLLRILKSMIKHNDHLIQRISIYILNSLACQVNSDEKQIIAKHGAIKVMILIIEERLRLGICDEVMEVAWSMMWNATDESEVNCKLFIESEGLDTFKSCLKAFPLHEELLRNMMGLLGNVAEVDSLRHHLMSNEFIVIFNDLLESNSDGIEVSYNACGVLANIVSDGDEIWHVDAITRLQVMDNMHRAIDRWPLAVERNINYRSFKPIVKLLKYHDSPAVQHWATWALCNLTTVYEQKYCPLLLSENGEEILNQMYFDPDLCVNIRKLSSLILSTLTNFKNEKNNSAKFVNKEMELDNHELDANGVYNDQDSQDYDGFEEDIFIN